ncbi:hypothetical protein [Candidatus Colwellia aromaticivorans]|uniref:hypothetical protein n=1 Tax=Candidatus Colwellia aromaticivorans TaxID=2267621 RepID=UPI00109B73A3|nr:hypothetical protein [Candidatus Colwellia aromaticivorans]
MTTFVSVNSKQKQLNNLDDTILHFDNLERVCNLQQDNHVLKDIQSALKFSMSTFTREKIRGVYITKNTDTEYNFKRPYYHGGSSEGKKIGHIDIYKVS